MEALKKLAARLPRQWQLEMKRHYFASQIRRGTFRSEEPEFDLLHTLVKPGDWVIDIGANVGHYTKRLSDLAGPTGRVIAFEPVPTTFTLLAANVLLFSNANVTLINAAVSTRLDIVGMSMPSFSSGLTNYYEARLTDGVGTGLSVLTLALDALQVGKRIALIKIDAEGHESSVLAGMQSLLERHHPVLIVETGSQEVMEGLVARSYAVEKLQNSPNVIFRPV